MSQPVLLYDTTLRDGTQREGLVLSLADKLRIARRLDEAGFPYVEGGWPGSNPKDEEFFALARAVTFRNARLAAFGSTRHRSHRVADDPNIRALLAAGTPVVTIFGKSWLLHVTHVLGATAQENLAMIGDSVGHVAAAGREVIYDAEHFFDGYKADPDYAVATLRAALAAGATTLVLCDTNGGCLTDEVSAITRSVADALQGGATLGIHVHDDAGLAVANSLAAVAAGARHVQGTINGYGERCGNANLVTIWANLALKLGVPTIPSGADLTHLGELSRFVAEVANIAPDAHQPYVGHSAFAHKGGVHGAATMRVEHAYQHVDPARVGGQTRLVVSELGGRANAAWRAARVEELVGESIDPAALSSLVKRLEADGASFEGAEASFELLVRRQQPDYRPPFRIVDFTVVVEQRAEVSRRAEASVKVEVDGELFHTAADGNGPVHALDRALRKALSAFYPALDAIHLVDYKVRILDGEAATGAKTRVVIETGAEQGTWLTAGADTNIIAASVEALRDSFEYALWRLNGRLERRDERQAGHASGLTRFPPATPAPAEVSNAARAPIVEGEVA
jgi:2-isopropylmalate synthase